MDKTKQELVREGFSEAEVDAILQRAAELQSQAERQASVQLSQEALKAGARAAGIREEFVQQAIKELHARRERERARRAAWRRRLTVSALIIGAFVAISALFSYPVLSTRLAAVEQQRAQLENVLQRRHDLLQGLMVLMEESTAQERELKATLQALLAELQRTPDFAERQRLEQKLSEVARQLTAVFTRFSDEIAGAENRIAVERKRYNEAIAAYNRAAQSFPVLLVRPFLGFPARLPYFSQEETRS
ncbi:MAG: LemA family protein [Candidatus Bipolaricaulota bacterium]|nr:LemA family protein [Candidatus Bipolaricaulota bacterium]MDW8031809.1 LemA family protein [Candidatus Bipolaricaulota bacterium]